MATFKFLSQMRNFNPVNSIIVTSAIVLALVLTGSLVEVAALTSMILLIYYAVTNLSALKLHPEKRLFPNNFCCGANLLHRFDYILVARTVDLDNSVTSAWNSLCNTAKIIEQFNC